LAPVVIDELGEVFVRLGEAGTAILLIEQNLGLIRQVAQRYYVLSKGSVVEAGDLAGISVDALKKHVAV
jgi:branched-chain amino acid transport system ATP-binding protein